MSSIFFGKLKVIFFTSFHFQFFQLPISIWVVGVGGSGGSKFKSKKNLALAFELEAALSSPQSFSGDSPSFTREPRALTSVLQHLYGFPQLAAAVASVRLWIHYNSLLLVCQGVFRFFFYQLIENLRLPLLIPHKRPWGGAVSLNPPLGQDFLRCPSELSQCLYYSTLCL